MTLKPNMSWKKSPVPLEYFTEDVVQILTDIDIYETAGVYSLHCEILIHPGKYFMGSSSGFALQKNSPLKEVIDYQLLKFLQTGLKEQLTKKYFVTKQHICEPPIMELDFKAIILSFAILASGVGISLIASLVEKYQVHIKI